MYILRRPQNFYFCLQYILLSVCNVDKSKVEISQNVVAFSEFMNFILLHHVEILNLIYLTYLLISCKIGISYSPPPPKIFRRLLWMSLSVKIWRTCKTHKFKAQKGTVHKRRRQFEGHRGQKLLKFADGQK